MSRNSVFIALSFITVAYVVAFVAPYLVSESSASQSSNLNIRTALVSRRIRQNKIRQVVARASKIKQPIAID